MKTYQINKLPSSLTDEQKEVIIMLKDAKDQFRRNLKYLVKSGQNTSNARYIYESVEMCHKVGLPDIPIDYSNSNIKIVGENGKEWETLPVRYLDWDLDDMGFIKSSRNKHLPEDHTSEEYQEYLDCEESRIYNECVLILDSIDEYVSQLEGKVRFAELS